MHVAVAPANDWILPQFDFHVEDLGHPGAKLFFSQINPYDALRRAVEASWKWLYGWDGRVGKNKVPRAVQSVKRITLTLRSTMDGVAHTFGSGEGEKQVHFALKHIVNSHQGDTAEKKNTRVREEILGVLVHEIVHCYQYNGKGKAPGGLIEGIADCVRLHDKLPPPHWKRVAPKGKHVPDPERPNDPGEWKWDWNWDAGYERTAYFFDWIDSTWQTWPESSRNTLQNTTSRSPPVTSAAGSAPPPSATSMPELPLPYGWIKQEHESGHPFYVDTRANPPRSIWTHPCEDEQYLKANPSPSPSGPSPPIGKGLFFRALNARLEESDWESEADLFLELTNWPREALWEAYCADYAPPQ